MSPKSKQVIEQKISEISRQITPLADDLKTCKSIQLQVSQIKKAELRKKLRKEEKQQEPKKNKPKSKDYER